MNGIHIWKKDGNSFVFSQVLLTLVLPMEIG